MKTLKLMGAIAMLAITMFILFPQLSWAADNGADLYKTKCAVCHGADGAGKPAAKIPSLTSDEVKKMPDAEVADAIANGGKNKKASHAYAAKGMTPDQVKSLVAHIRELGKK
jgi:cytochrome c6